jgi:hypothetical protein
MTVQYLDLTVPYLCILYRRYRISPVDIGGLGICAESRLITVIKCVKCIVNLHSS